MNNTSLPSASNSVKAQSTQSALEVHPEKPARTELIPVLLRRGAILDFEQANVAVLDANSAPWESLESLGAVNGAEMLRLPGTAIAVHFDCDEDGFRPWVRASSVFCRDQRSPIEKLTGLRVGRE